MPPSATMVTLAALTSPLWYPASFLLSLLPCPGSYEGPPVSPHAGPSISAPSPTHRAPHVLVLVLGDVGRSPRMQYHALSLLEAGYEVTLLGYAGSPLCGPLSAHVGGGRLKVVRVSPTARFKSFKPLYYPLRLLSVTRSILWHALQARPLLSGPGEGGYDVLLLQNPPALPTFLIAMAVSFFGSRDGFYTKGRCRVVIDWHNLGYR